MSLVVPAGVIRDLIVDGDYLVECIEQRERGCLLVTLALRSRVQTYNLQIETTDHKLEGLFRALLPESARRPGDKPTRQVGSQVVPVVEVDSMPADQSKPRRRRPTRVEQPPSQTVADQPTRAERRRAAMRQLTLVADAPQRVEQPSLQAGKRRGRPKSVRAGESL
ncbi:MAG TPA: hypothetical protein VNP04_12470 [Alphaproteobacteria bacterium]|nr:hypothetical protein [Alphaproteobacteria bacterium]